MRVLIIGGGFVGVACWQILKAAGADPVIMKPHCLPPVSRGWFLEEFLQGDYFETLRPAWWTEAHALTSLAALPGLGASTGPIRLREDLSGESSWIDDGAWLLPGGGPGPNPAPDLIMGEAEQITRVDGGLKVFYDGGKAQEAEAVIIAAGYLTDEFLWGCGWQKLGSSAVHGQVLLFGSLNMDAPTRVLLPEGQFWVFQDGQIMEVGPVWEEDPDPTGAAARDLALRVARLIDPEVMSMGNLAGYRDVGPGGKLYVHEVEERILAVGGTDRMGLGLAGGLAHEALGRIASWA